MATLFTRSQFRDQIRRKLQIVPPVDEGVGPEGAQPDNAPNPTNAQINDAFTQAIADINITCGWHQLDISVPVAAQTATSIGPFCLELAGLTPNTTGAAIGDVLAYVNDIRRVLWTGASMTVPILLSPTNRDSLDRNDMSTYYAITPGQPQSWYCEGYRLYLTPAQFEAGTLDLLCGEGVPDFRHDSSTLDHIPADWQGMFVDRTIFRLALMFTQDIEWQDRAAAYGPLSQTEMQQFKGWRGGDAASQPVVGLVTYRNTYANRRTIR